MDAKSTISQQLSIQHFSIQPAEQPRFTRVVRQHG